MTALCCFTPFLVVLFGILGIAGLVGYLDYVFVSHARRISPVVVGWRGSFFFTFQPGKENKG